MWTAMRLLGVDFFSSVVCNIPTHTFATGRYEHQTFELFIIMLLLIIHPIRQFMPRWFLHLTIDFCARQMFQLHCIPIGVVYQACFFLCRFHLDRIFQYVIPPTELYYLHIYKICDFFFIFSALTRRIVFSLCLIYVSFEVDFLFVLFVIPSFFLLLLCFNCCFVNWHIIHTIFSLFTCFKAIF